MSYTKVKMFKSLCKGIISAIIVADTTAALSLLQDNQAILFHPFEGPLLHAEILYYAIKKANVEVIRYLLGLHVDSDIPFYNFCGHTPLSLVVETGLNEVVPEVIAKTDKNFALSMAVKFQNSKIINLLLKQCVFKDRLLKYLNLR